MRIEWSFSTRNCIQLMMACGLLHIGAYYMAGSFASPTSHLAVPQPDTLLYCQSARQIAEGMPFIYTPGEKPSTGNTTHLYPFVLAALYKMGAKGDALLTAGFALNALFYLIFLANWGAIVGRLTTSPIAACVACALLVLSGQPIFGALAQSDVGFFLAVSSGLFAALLADRMGVFAVLLILSPWCRPEGAMFSILFFGFLLMRTVCRQRVVRSEWAIAGLAMVSTASMFAFNYGLTGYVQFQSVYYKGYFKQFDFLAGLNHVLTDMIRMGRELFLGVPKEFPRESLSLPCLGALFAWGGLLMRPWKGNARAWKEIWWLAACLGGIAVVASSGWQNTNADRYLVWLMPIWLLYISEGAVALTNRLPVSFVRPLPLLLLIGYQALGTAWFVSLYYTWSLDGQREYDFAKEANAVLPASASVGGEPVNLAYAFPGRRMLHLDGIYSPDMMENSVILNIDRLKQHPEWRFDYWFFPEDTAMFAGEKMDVLCGPPLALDVKGASVRKTHWEALDRALIPPEGSVAADGWRLVGRVDVGYPEDEKRCEYETYSRFYRVKYAPFSFLDGEGTNGVLDVGRLILGSDSMSVRLVPDRPVRVVLRTVAKAKIGARLGSGGWMRDYTFASPLKLNVQTDAGDAGTFALPLSTNETVFSELSLTLPAAAIRKTLTRMTVSGDHAVFGYWFYQPVP